MDELKLDVQEVESGDVSGTRISSIDETFDRMNGPLWFTKFIDVTSNKESSSSSTEDSSRIFNFTCVFGFWHVLVDGTSNVKFCVVFLKTLNDLLLGRDVDMKVEIEFVEPLEDRLIDQENSRDRIKSTLFCANVSLRKFYRYALSWGRELRNFTKYYPEPRTEPAATHYVDLELDAETTNRLLQRCKKEEVTLNSVFAAATNIAFFRISLEKDSKLNSTKYRHNQIVNMRRYWPKEQIGNSGGCHISSLDIQVFTKKDDIGNFWPYAREVHRKLCKSLTESRTALRVLPLACKMRQTLVSNSLLKYPNLPSINDCHFSVTNMGNLDKFFISAGEVVVVTKVHRQSVSHHYPFLMEYFLQSYRGKLFVTLNYYAHKVSKETALILMKNLRETLIDIASTDVRDKEMNSN